MLFGWEMHIFVSRLNSVKRRKLVQGNGIEKLSQREFHQERWKRNKQEGMMCPLTGQREEMGTQCLTVYTRAKAHKKGAKNGSFLTERILSSSPYIEFFQKVRLWNGLMHNSLKKPLFKNTSNQGTEITGKFTFHWISFCPLNFVPHTTYY